MESNLSIFKIGVGPSSSHTVGPMLASNMFCDLLGEKIEDVCEVKIDLYGSLSLTGKGHLTDIACIIGLNKVEAKDLTPSLKNLILDLAFCKKKIKLAGQKSIHFDPSLDVVFHREFLPLHENGMKLSALDFNGRVLKSQVYYSTGGGFISTQEELENPRSKEECWGSKISFGSAVELLDICKKMNLSIAEFSLAYENQFASTEEIHRYCLEIWRVMQDSYFNGINTKETVLPGALKLKRRAPALAKKQANTSDPLAIVDLISLYAMSVSEENASGGRVVTAPTNGACGVIPAVMLYLKHYLGDTFNDKCAIDFLLVAMIVGSLYKKNASISGAEAGCQAEIGSASSMAAGAAAAILGGDNQTILIAAEIAMEHHLGLTCDPVGGLVQIPCIERNAFGAIKAISAARIALDRADKNEAYVGLDEVIATMYETGKDMDLKYRETALGGLALTLKKCC